MQSTGPGGIDKADCSDLVRFSGCVAFSGQRGCRARKSYLREYRRDYRIDRSKLDAEIAHFVQSPHYETRGDASKLGRGCLHGYPSPARFAH
jgi:hypothetical protein